MILPYDRGRLAQVVIYYYMIRHSSDANIRLCRKHKPYHCTYFIQISKQSRDHWILAPQSVLQLLLFPDYVSFFLKPAQILTICTLNVVDLGSLLPQLPLLCAFAMPQSCLLSIYGGFSCCSACKVLCSRQGKSMVSRYQHSVSFNCISLSQYWDQLYRLIPQFVLPLLSRRT